MKIQRLHLDGFGRWTDMDIEFAPGLNVIYGANEAGKSTMQQAILAMLYGLSSQRTNGQSVLEHFRPWHGSDYGGSLEYQLDSGHGFRISRSFTGGEMTTALVDVATGRDLSSVFRGERSGRVDIAAKHLGIPREIFVRTQFIRQQDLGPLNDAAYEIGEQIANAMDPLRRNRAVAQAQAILQQALAEQVGSQRASDTPLALVDERLQELLVEKKMVQLHYRRLLDDLMAQSQSQRELDAAARERDRLKYRLTLARLNSVAYRIREIEKLMASEVTLREQYEALQAFADFPLKTREVVMRYAQERQLRLERLARAEGAVKPSRAQVDEWQTQVAKWREQVRALESARNIPVEHEPAARELERTLPEAIHEFQRIDDDLNAVKQSIAALEPVRQQTQRQRPASLGGTDQVHDLRLQWDLLNQQITGAEREAGEAEERWRLYDLSDDAYKALERRAGDLTPPFVEKVRKHQLTATNLQVQIGRSRENRAMRVFRVAAILSALIGVTLAVSTILDARTNWGVEAGAFLLVAVLAGSATVVTRFLVEQARSAVKREQEVVRQSLEGLGFGSVSEMEMFFTRYQQARPAYENWQRSKAMLDKMVQEREAIRAQLVPLMQASIPDDLTPQWMEEAEAESKRRARDLDELSRLERQREVLERAWQAQHEVMQQVVQQTRAILKAADMIELNLLADLRSFLVLCQNRRELDQVEAQLHELEAILQEKLDNTLALEAELRTERTALMGIQDELRLILQHIGIGADELNEALKDYDQRYEQAERFLRTKTILESLEREAKALLRTETLDELKRLLDSYTLALHTLVQNNPELAAVQAEQGEESLQAALTDAQHRVDKLNSELAGIERRLDEGTTGYRALAEVEEDITLAQERITQLTVEGQAMQVASEQLLAAAEDYHRNFLPRLTQMLARDLEASTAGQYSQVQVDRSDLRVRLAVPALPELIAPEQLSQAVQDQVYLLLRFGLAELISDGRESLPFLLDDPFVNYDEERLLRTLNLMARVAEHTQLLLFTKDYPIVRWFTGQSFDPATAQLLTLG